MPLIGIVDYGSGNVQSVRNAVEYLGYRTMAVSGEGDFHRASHLILPGVGSFPASMRELRRRGLIDPLRRAVRERGLPYLGICVGEQILADRGFEFGETEGLGIIAGSTRKIDTNGTELPLPHIGWNEVDVRNGSPLYRGIESGSCFYFVHGYHLVAEDPREVSATTRYGAELTASVEREHVFGVQFHPEKSQSAGLKLLDNFCRL